MLFGIFKTFSGSKVQLVEFLYEIAYTFPLYSIQLSGMESNLEICLFTPLDTLLDCLDANKSLSAPVKFVLAAIKPSHFYRSLINSYFYILKCARAMF